MGYSHFRVQRDMQWKKTTLSHQLLMLENVNEFVVFVNKTNNKIDQGNKRVFCIQFREKAIQILS